MVFIQLQTGIVFKYRLGIHFAPDLMILYINTCMILVMTCIIVIFI